MWRFWVLGRLRPLMYAEQTLNSQMLVSNLNQTQPWTDVMYTRSCCDITQRDHGMDQYHQSCGPGVYVLPLGGECSTLTCRCTERFLSHVSLYYIIILMITNYTNTHVIFYYFSFTALVCSYCTRVHGFTVYRTVVTAVMEDLVGLIGA